MLSGLRKNGIIKMADECEESGCRHVATKDWHGKKVCADHYDRYRDEYEKMMLRLQGT